MELLQDFITFSQLAAEDNCILKWFSINFEVYFLKTIQRFLVEQILVSQGRLAKDSHWFKTYISSFSDEIMMCLT